jgi:cadmium resistance protein CadD (predicted permease)
MFSNKDKKLLLSLIPLGIGIYWAISGFDSRDQYLKERLATMDKAKELEKPKPPSSTP